jgi:hypothetical protein
VPLGVEEGIGDDPQELPRVPVRIQHVESGVIRRDVDDDLDPVRAQPRRQLPEADPGLEGAEADRARRSELPLELVVRASTAGPGG